MSQTDSNLHTHQCSVLITVTAVTTEHDMFINHTNHKKNVGNNVPCVIMSCQFLFHLLIYLNWTMHNNEQTTSAGNTLVLGSTNTEGLERTAV